MSEPANAIHCVFYSHPWAIDAIRSDKIGALDDTLLIELSPASQIAAMLGKGEARRGIGAVLAAPERLIELVEKHQRLAAPIVLAAQPSVPDSVQVGAIGLLPTLKSRFRRFVLLIHVNEYDRYIHALSYVEKFYFLWDLADPPAYPLANLGRTLEALGSLTRETWGGFYCFVHPQRRIPDAAKRMGQLRNLIQLAPALAPPKAAG
ncbi:MAG: hypothetical protein MUE46_04630 [Xanthomonadales bacterium]|jgi:hypothetical protein|nr:hypothetical protein [Xanthomonadales bacterium]